MRKTLIGILAFLPLLLWAFPTDEATLLSAYMEGNMSVWKAYVDSSDWAQLSSDEKVRYINYEYGYVATLIDVAPAGQKTKKKGISPTAAYVARFGEHIEEAKSILAPSRYCLYRSAYFAYDYMLSKSLNSAIKSFQLCKQAVQEDDHDPLALSLMANVDFYAPRIVGGNKEKALDLYLQAKQILLSNDALYLTLWNNPATRLCIVQCYDKLGQIEKAIDEAQSILERYPNFVYLRDEYLPELQNKKTGH